MPYKFIAFIISFILCIRSFLEATKWWRVIIGTLIFGLFILPMLLPALFLFDKTGLVLLNARIVAGICSYLYLRIKGVKIR